MQSNIKKEYRTNSNLIENFSQNLKRLYSHKLELIYLKVHTNHIKKTKKSPYPVSSLYIGL